MPIATPRSGSLLEADRAIKRLRLEEEGGKNEESNAQLDQTHSVTGIANAGQSSSQYNEGQMVEEQTRLPIEFQRDYEYELDYRNKLVLAPMVRTGSRALSCSVEIA